MYLGNIIEINDLLDVQTSNNPLTLKVHRVTSVVVDDKSQFIKLKTQDATGTRFSSLEYYKGNWYYTSFYSDILVQVSLYKKYDVDKIRNDKICV